MKRPSGTRAGKDAGGLFWDAIEAAMPKVRRRIALNLRIAREELGLSQSQLARAARLGRGYICRMESGQELNICGIERLAFSLDIPIAVLLQSCPVGFLKIDPFCAKLFTLTRNHPNRLDLLDVLWQLHQPDWKKKQARLAQYPFSPHPSRHF